MILASSLVSDLAELLRPHTGPDASQLGAQPRTNTEDEKPSMKNYGGIANWSHVLMTPALRPTPRSWA
jgi:hypothetical protein